MIPIEQLIEILSKLDNEVKSGNISLTIEQMAGALMQIGYNWGQYKGLRKFFTGE